MEELKQMKYTLFDTAWFFEHTAEYMLKIGNKDQMMEFSYKHDGLMAVIESLGLVDEYRLFVEKGELK